MRKEREYRFTGCADIAPGDTIYLIRQARYKRPYKPEIEKTVASAVIFMPKHVYVKLQCNSMYETSIDSLGKTIFLDYSEALAALEECKKRAQ